MVVAFGWGAGGFAKAVEFVYKVSKAFKDAGGAKEQYSEAAAFLDSFAMTLSRPNDYTSTNPAAKLTSDIEKQVELISTHYVKFDKYCRNTTVSSIVQQWSSDEGCAQEGAVGDRQAAGQGR